MSFFTSLQNYVTSGVAGLGLSPRKFSLSRQDSQEGSQQQSHAQTGGVTTGGGVGGVPSVQLGGETVSGQKPISSTPVHGKFFWFRSQFLTEYSLLANLEVISGLKIIFNKF